MTGRLARLDVTVLDGSVAEVQRISVALADGQELASAVTIWTAGFGVPELAAPSGLRTDALGRLPRPTRRSPAWTTRGSWRRVTVPRRPVSRCG